MTPCRRQRRPGAERGPALEGQGGPGDRRLERPGQGDLPRSGGRGCQGGGELLPQRGEGHRLRRRRQRRRRAGRRGRRHGGVGRPGRPDVRGRHPRDVPADRGGARPRGHPGEQRRRPGIRPDHELHAGGVELHLPGERDGRVYRLPRAGPAAAGRRANGTDRQHRLPGGLPRLDQRAPAVRLQQGRDGLVHTGERWRPRESTSTRWRRG